MMNSSHRILKVGKKLNVLVLTFDMIFSGFRIGPIAIVGIPGEAFNAIGKGIKESEGYKMIIPCCLTNGNEGYFPMQDSYDEGGYESRSSNFKAGVSCGSNPIPTTTKKALANASAFFS